jgi:hypothetical protein
VPVTVTVGLSDVPVNTTDVIDATPPVCPVIVLVGVMPPPAVVDDTPVVSVVGAVVVPADAAVVDDDTVDVDVTEDDVGGAEVDVEVAEDEDDPPPLHDATASMVTTMLVMAHPRRTAGMISLSQMGDTVVSADDPYVGVDLSRPFGAVRDAGRTTIPVDSDGDMFSGIEVAGVS